MDNDKRKAAVVSSALWAAAGDALGWITELADEQTVSYRTGKVRVEETVDWKRRIGGRFGPVVHLPSGTYSDDTQLRLSVSRAIRGTGEFDVAAFAKVELPVWLSYSLGAGRGTTAAASNLAKSSVTWFSNFFSSRDGRGYFTAGGNGAAMRIQPHVWRSRTPHFEEFIADLLKDAVTTHGHPIGFCGAVFHGLSLAYALESGQLPGPAEWKDFIGSFSHLARIVKNDEQLGLFWIGPWEERFGSGLQKAVGVEAERALSLVNELEPLLKQGPAGYQKLLRSIGGFDDATRGSGTNTALAASALALYGADMSAEDTLRLGANAIGSDTDTIASMAGAILGAVQGGEPAWKIQDRSYIVEQAARMADIASGTHVASFQYPDLMGWSPPTTQVDAVGTTERTLWLAGLGKAEAVGEVWTGADAEWQWLRLEFGQSVFAKRRASPRGLSKADLPAERSNRRAASQLSSPSETPSLFSSEPPQQVKNPVGKTRSAAKSSDRTALANPKSPQSIDELTEWVIAENFHPEIIGKAFLQAAQGVSAVDRCIALAAVVAKAIDARRRRSLK